MISESWTAEERLEIVAKIAEQLATLPAVKRDWVLMDIQERLIMLAKGSASILELNRKEIINGHKAG